MLFLLLANAAAALELKFGEPDGRPAAEFWDGEQRILSPIASGVSFTLHQPGGSNEVAFSTVAKTPDGATLTGAEVSGLRFTETWKRRAAGLWERSITVEAMADGRYFLDMSWTTASGGTFHTFLAEEREAKSYSLGLSGPGFDDASSQTFPMAGVQLGERFYGLVGDSPGLWENQSVLKIAPESRTIGVANGDGSASRVTSIPRELDATTVYRARVDGWQRIEAGQRQQFTTWVYSSDVQNRYDIQLSAHLALANAKGFNGSALEAILRNTSYLLLRRNLFRPESDYIFVSGVGYGWKQWVSDGFWMSRGLDHPVYDQAANAAVFYDRLNYEENAQYFLIWSYLVRQAGGEPDPRTLSRAYHFIRKHEVDGLYVPPRLVPDKAYFKTYHDQLPYDDDDAPSSNQGFHCGALMAAQALGFEVSDEDIERAIAGFARMFNEAEGYIPTSLKQQENVGQDSLYGEVLTYAVFGRKLLPSQQVHKHIETTMKIQTPYGMRVISKANGDLLDGHSGVYVYGGSWFLNDATVYLDGLIHGIDAAWIDDQLLWRLERELAWMPAFHESISTTTGKPHGHHLYSWNSGFWWLRREVRARLGLTEPDPLAARLDARLGVIRVDGALQLRPGPADLQRSTPEG